MSAPRRLGVVGAGTMGAGIAQLAAAAGMETVLSDPVAEGLEKGRTQAEKGLAKWAEKGRIADGGRGELITTESAEGLAGCELVIEAAPERPDLKRDIFAAISEACGEDTVIASNTSSIPITALAGGATHPENVVGMHFFNPPPLMKLVEVIAAQQSGEPALEMARACGEAMGKRVIDAADGPGFLVNRCGRPFYSEALRIVQEGIAGPEQVDRIVRVGGGFRMGPFELMDLVGIDVGFAVSQSFNDLSFGEPRWKPNPIQARMVAAGRLGRKTGRGFYEYAEDGSYRDDDPEPLERAADAPAIRLVGAPRELLDRARDLGLDVEAADGATVVSCRAASLARQCGDSDACGIVIGPPLAEANVAEATRLPGTAEATSRATEAFLAGLGLRTEWVQDGPGLVLRRIVCQLVNEAAFAIGEGVGSAEDVDAGLKLGLNHPRGPVEWSELISPELVLETLEGLWAERQEERYRAAPLLRRAVSLGWSSIAAP